ncbi:tetraacyldisaccharide 4'-kinase [Pararhizobium mangrovi]|uniref:Tetraacyldisaccharide 4'-kinase n=1 Tax=Pararhizobium mangrovi TaxID=2590452 RepID=A0A506U065_9HYPH|nr:tetraacyldisaccharide 4'-kinase [Pararhizobium mangrovi]TPW26601.1 tetraacyldisaccharide 4'-kinase [Pararhizobium mangrovi]
MARTPPPFWWREGSWQAGALAPFGGLVGAIAARRMDHAPRVPAGAPVLCVGNFTVGGAGKTPTALALAGRARERGLAPGFLSRGYARASDGTLVVDPAVHTAADVGDEPLLLARDAPTVVATDRVEGARKLLGEGVDFIVMDDGFQSARLGFDAGILVVDATRGLGNGRVLPAGPLRAPLERQLVHADALILVGEGNAADGIAARAKASGRAVHRAHLVPRDDGSLAGCRVLAFAAIGDPEKFFRTVVSLGADLCARHGLRDHQAIDERKAADLLAEAERLGAMPVTTAKDAVRLAGAKGAAGELLRAARVVEVDMVFDRADAADAMIDTALAAFAAREGPA